VSTVKPLTTRSGIVASMAVRNARIVGFALLPGALLWEVIGRTAPSSIFAPLSSTVGALGGLFGSGELFHALGESGLLYLAGVGSALVVGAFFGILLARVTKLRVGVEPYVNALYATPMVALIPFILSTLGLGFTPKALLVFLFAVFPILVITMEGARSVSVELLEVARSFHSNEYSLWIHLIIPHTLPFVASGLRQAIARGLVGVISAEFFLSASGLGELLRLKADLFQTAEVLAVTLVVTLLGVLLMDFGRRLENRFATWRS
jgi:ABC-type nitrate/sulfonate/bicarbonate transport system permease component